MLNIRKRILSLLLILCMALSLAVLSPSRASADDAIITKILTTISATPVALMDPATISASTSTQGCYIAGAAWYDAAGNMAYGAFNVETYRLEIYIVAMDGYVIDPNAACYLNNSAVTAVPDGTGKGMTLMREYTAAVWAPTVYKQPGNETVNEYSWASFVVSGTYARDYQWMLVNPTGTDYIMISSLKTRFPDMDASGNGTEKLILSNIPYELNGWRVVCNFIGAGDGNITQSQGAILTVLPDPSRAAATAAAAAIPTPTPTTAPTPTPDTAAASPAPETASGSDAGTETAEPEEEAEEHVHSFSLDWSHDANHHWHECLEDGARSSEAPHIMQWTETRAASTSEPGEETGTCEICGYTETRETPVLEKAPFTMPGTLLSALLLLVPIDLLLLIIHPIAASRQYRRARRKRSHR